MEKSQIIESLHTQVKKGAGGDWGEAIVIDGFKVEHVETKGGEDEGSSYSDVYFIVSNDGALSMYVLVTGYYSSYDGVDWEYGDASEVVPHEKTVKAWKTV